MKALLYKDFLVAKKYLKMLFVMDLLFVTVSIFGSSETPFLTIFPLVMCAPTVTSLLSYDERFRFDRSCDMLPVSRKTQVDEKYLLALGYVAVIFLLCALGVFRRFPAGGERTLLLTAMLAGGLLPVSLLLPVMFRLGTEKGRIFYYVIYIASLALTYGASGVDVTGVQAQPGPGLFWGTLLVLLALFALSRFLSVRFYRNREL